MTRCAYCDAPITERPIVRGGCSFETTACALNWMLEEMPLPVYPVPSVATLLGGPRGR